jgi:hypothetical protein
MSAYSVSNPEALSRVELHWTDVGLQRNDAGLLFAGFVILQRREAYRGGEAGGRLRLDAAGLTGFSNSSASSHAGKEPNPD